MIKNNRFFHPDLEDVVERSSSGWLVRKVNTPLGALEITHGVMGTDGASPREARYTSLQLGDLPEIFLPENIKNIENPQALYWESLIKLGGATGIAEAILKAYNRGLADGANGAREAIRIALGLF